MRTVARVLAALARRASLHAMLLAACVVALPAHATLVYHWQQIAGSNSIASSTGRLELTEAAGMPHDYPLMRTPEGAAARRAIATLLR